MQSQKQLDKNHYETENSVINNAVFHLSQKHR